MRNTHTFVLRVLLDQEDSSPLRGQISEPSSADEWRASFVDVNELLQQLLKRVAAAPGSSFAEPSDETTKLEIELALKRVELIGK